MLFKMTCWKKMTHLRIMNAIVIKNDQVEVASNFDIFKSVLQELYKQYGFPIIFEIDEESMKLSGIFDEMMMLDVTRLLDKIYSFTNTHFPGIPVILQLNLVNTTHVSEMFINGVSMSKQDIWVKVGKPHEYNGLFSCVDKVIVQSNHLFIQAHQNAFGTVLNLPIMDTYTYRDSMAGLLDKNPELRYKDLILEIDTEGLELTTIEDRYVINMRKMSFNAFQIKLKRGLLELEWAEKVVPLEERLYASNKMNTFYEFDSFDVITDKCKIVKHSGMAGVSIGDIGKDVYSHMITGAITSINHLQSVFNHCALLLQTSSQQHDCRSYEQESADEDEISNLEGREDNRDTNADTN